MPALYRNGGSKAELKGLTDECDSFVTAHIQRLRQLLYGACGRYRRQKIDSDLLPRTYARAIVGIGMRGLFCLNTLIESERAPLSGS